MLGLDPPSRDACADGECADASPGVVKPAPGTGTTSGGPTVTPTLPAVDDAGSPPGDDASTVDPTGTVDAGPDVASRTLRCGAPTTHDQYCDPSLETCCASSDGHGGFTFACYAGGPSVCGNDVPITCARQADCPGTSVCCATSNYQMCVESGTCNGNNVSLVCDPQASPSECPSGYSCVPFQNPSIPYYACR